MSNIKIKYKLKEKIIDPAEVTGGIQLLIDDTRVNKFQEESTNMSIYDWYPEYVGKYLQADLRSLISITHKIATGDLDIYDFVITDFNPTPEYFLLEPLSESQIRVAFRSHGSHENRLAVPKNACGYVVDRDSFCQAVSDVGHEYINGIDFESLLANEDMINDFEKHLNNLDMSISNHL